MVIFTAIGPGVVTVIAVLTATGWVIYGRVARSIVLSVKELPYVDAAVVTGCKTRRVLLRHILPNLAAPILTLCVLDFARVVLAESALSFLGLGVQPPAISWGYDIAAGRTSIFNAWWLVTFPGIALSITVISINLVAGWLRVAIDPQQRDKKFIAAATEGAV
jgi:peptide/nickel transport system permease protein